MARQEASRRSSPQEGSRHGVSATGKEREVEALKVEVQAGYVAAWERQTVLPQSLIRQHRTPEDAIATTRSSQSLPQGLDSCHTARNLHAATHPSSPPRAGGRLGGAGVGPARDTKPAVARVTSTPAMQMMMTARTIRRLWLPLSLLRWLLRWHRPHVRLRLRLRLRGLRLRRHVRRLRRLRLHL